MEYLISFMSKLWPVTWLKCSQLQLEASGWCFIVFNLVAGFLELRLKSFWGRIKRMQSGSISQSLLFLGVIVQSRSLGNLFDWLLLQASEAGHHIMRPRQVLLILIGHLILLPWGFLMNWWQMQSSKISSTLCFLLVLSLALSAGLYNAFINSRRRGHKWDTWDIAYLQCKYCIYDTIS